MADISVAKAAGAGLRLIRREPLAVLGWAGLNLVLSAAMLTLLGGLIAQVAAMAGQPEPQGADLIGLQMQMMGLQPLFTLSGIVMQTLLMGAVFRAVLQPDERRWAYLRLSGQELWLGLVTVAISFGLGFGVAVLMLPLAAVAAFVSLAFRETLGAWGMASVGIAAVLAVVTAVVWLMLRLSMAYPMSFSDRNFRLFESWTLTRGHTGSLFLVYLLAVLMAVAIQAVGFAVAATAVLASTGPNWQALLSGDPLLLFRTGGSLIAVFVVLYSLLGALTAAIVTAPLAYAYRQLRAADA
jgi:hypothetical protein